jgi:streptogramin lyase
VIRGFIYPPADGAYTFFIASTNEGQVWISKEGGLAERADTMVAHVEKWCAPHDWSACTNTPVELK